MMPAHPRPPLASLVALLLAAACSGSSPTAAVDGAVPYTPSPLVVARPYQSKVPIDYTPSRAWPLVVLLHGYSASAVVQDAYFGISRIVDDKGFLYAFPDGVRDKAGNRFWNATDACCSFASDGPPPDDVAYLDAVIDDMSARYRVDPRRVFLIGHSNGGYMAYRYACDRASRLAGLLSLAGAVWKDPARCAGGSPVSVFALHGDADDSVKYDGGSEGAAPYPSAKETVATFAKLDGCAAPLADTGVTYALDGSLPDARTTVARYGACAAPGVTVELWTLHGSGHVPSLPSTFAALAVDTLVAHPKP